MTRLMRRFACVLSVLLAGSGTAEEIFVDRSEQAEIRFVHEAGIAQGHRHLFETMVGGAAWLDYDGDGELDLYLVQAHADAGKANRPGRQSNVLLRNRGDGTFEDVTDRAGVGDRGYGSGVAIGDVDNDGDTDLLVTNYGPNVFYLNRGDGTFEELSGPSGLADPLWNMSAAFVDLDGDAFLDVYVTNYLDYRLGVHKGCTGNRLKKPDYCHPNKFGSAPDRIYKGLGDGTFQDVCKQAGVAISGLFKGKSLGVLPTDIDGDGDVDLIVACDSVPNLVWRNLGDFRFEDVALEMGIALNPDGKALAGMGIDGGDVNGDGVFDYTITNFAKESNTLYLGNPSGFLFEGSAAAGLAGPTFLPLGFDCKLFDYDLDGDLDVYYTCGHVSSLVEELYPSGAEKRLQPDLLLENDGKGRFRDISERSGKWFARKLVGRGAAFADYDNDGDLDAYIVNMDGPGVLLRNEQKRGNHWIGLRLVGDGGAVNRDAFGSVVTVTSAGGVARKFEVRSAASYLSANDPRVLCGLGTETAVSGVEVRWPDGTVRVFRNLTVDAYNTIRY